ncbi:MAG: YheT family hydrolase [Vicinamibacterales bacterium]
MTPAYIPLPRWAGGHRMTLYAWGRPRRFPGLPAPEARLFQTDADTRVLAHCHWQADRGARPTVLLLHGLEGSSDAHYVRGMAEKAWRRGWNVVRLNQRNCGGTEHLTPRLYHSGLTADPRAVLEQLAAGGLDRFAVAGYSLGGNLALKLAGEFGDRHPAWLRAVAAVSPVLELETCVQAIERPENRIYEWNFCRGLQQRMRRKARAWPGAFDLDGLWRIWSIRRFDERYTAPHHGFDGASDYYHRASALRVAGRIAVPALVITAADDPFVPPGPFHAPALADNPRVTTVITPFGGHCGFVAEPGPAGDDDGYWAEATVIDFVGGHLAAPGAGAPGAAND